VSTRLRIDPITRLEGHGRIDIFLDEKGDVDEVYFQVPELRGFEAFCVGRQAEEMPLLTSRICGVCPEAHLMASVKALDELFQAPPPPAALKIRELVYSAFFVSDHATHFYALGGPDLIVGPDAPPGERNLLGVVKTLGMMIGKEVISCRARNAQVIKSLGGRSVNPVGAVPGGWSRPVKEEERSALVHAAEQNIQTAQISLALFEKKVLNEPKLRGLFEGDTYLHRTYSMGTVDARGQVNFYDGEVRVVSPSGAELLRYPARDYTSHLLERTERWTYLKFPYLKKVGWKGFVDGEESGVYTATPLARLNVSEGMPTPKAQEWYERLYGFFGSKPVGARREPVHQRMATHFARLIEMLYAAERMLELAKDPELTSPEVRNLPQGPVRREGGIGSVEAPRGTLTHHYRADERGVITAVNLIVGTTNNHAAIAMSLKRAAQGLIKAGQPATEALLNRVEMGFRLYDPCLSCATHAVGKMPLRIQIRSRDGELLQTLERGAGG
jgi:F420-non-reducing hydrogenase large subunit